MLAKLLEKFKSLDLTEKIFLAFLLLSQVFYFYRYAFRIGSSFSPPGYILTPNFLQFAKYPIAALFFLVLSYLVIKKFSISEILKKLNSQKFWLLLIIFLVYIGLSLLKFGISPSSFAITQYTKMLFVIPFVFLVPFAVRKEKWFDLATVFLALSIAYHIIYELIQLLLFAATGRLPGIAFSNLLPRYGAGWDDPNGFAAFAVLLITIWIVLKPLQSKVYDKTVLVSLVALDLLTYSTTGLIGLVIALGLLFVLRILSFGKSLFVGAIVAIFVIIHFLKDYVHLILQAKQYSYVEGHAISAAHPVVTNTSFLDRLAPLLGGFGTPLFHENTYYQFYLNFGAVGLLLFVLVIATTILAAFRGYLKNRKKSSLERSVFLISFVYLLSFSMMSVALPLLEVYPINLFTWVVTGLVWTFSASKNWKEFFGLDLLGYK